MKNIAQKSISLFVDYADAANFFLARATGISLFITKSSGEGMCLTLKACFMTSEAYR